MGFLGLDKVAEVVEETANTVSNTVEAAATTNVNVYESIATNILETGESVVNGDIEGVGQNLVELHTEPLHESVIGASETANAAGTDLQTVGTVTGGVVSTIYTGDPRTGMAVGSEVGKLGDKYADEGEITVDDVGEAAATSSGAYYGGPQGAVMGKNLYQSISDGNLTEDEILNVGKQYAESQGYGQHVPMAESLFQSVRDGELTKDEAINLGMQYAQSQGYGDQIEIATALANGELTEEQVMEMGIKAGMQYAQSQGYGQEAQMSQSLFNSFRDGELSQEEAMNAGVAYANYQGYGDYIPVAQALANGEFTAEQVTNIGIEYANSQGYINYSQEAQIISDYESAATDYDANALANALSYDTNTLSYGDVDFDLEQQELRELSLDLSDDADFGLEHWDTQTDGYCGC